MLRLVGLLDARQSEITDLQHAVAVHQQIARLDVSVQDPGRMQIFEAAQDLVQKNFDVVLRQVLWRHNYFVQVRLQKFCYHISVMERKRMAIAGVKENAFIQFEMLFCSGGEAGGVVRERNVSYSSQWQRNWSFIKLVLPSQFPGDAHVAYGD